MDISKSNILNFIQLPKNFVVPVYQRKYSWEESDCEQLLEDILQIIGNEQEQHFFGSVVYSEDLRNNMCFIVDGQQRVTTIMLLLCALKNINPSFETIFTQRYFVLNDGITKNIKLTLNKIDNEIFSKIINGEVMNDKDKESDLYKNYQFFYHFFENNTGYAVGEIEYALMRFDIALLKIAGENPQKIFDSVNFAGKKLTNLDRIKNYFLLPIKYNTQKELYHKYWVSIELLVGERINDFFVDWLIVRNKSDSFTSTKREHVNERTMYDVVKRDFPKPNESNIQSIFEEIYLYAKAYHTLLNAEEESELWHLIYTLDFKQAMPLLLYVVLEEENLDYCVHIVLSYVLRAILCGRKVMSKQNAAACIQRTDSFMGHGLDFKNALNLSITTFSGNSSFVTDHELKQKLLDTPVYNNKTRRYLKFLLFQFEKSISKTVPRFSDGTIEHIIPQYLSPDWIKTLTGYDKEFIASKTQQLGNLTLLEYNSEASNKPYEKKKEYYKTSVYQITRKIPVKESVFNLDSVNRRNQEFIEKLILLYEYPETIKVTFDEHSITENAYYFVGKKPTAYSCNLLGEDSVKTWAEMNVSILTNLYEYDENTFYALVYKNADWGLFDKKRRKAAEIGGYFIATGFSAIDILNYIKSYLMFYDAECGTSFVNDFRFKILEEKDND